METTTTTLNGVDTTGVGEFAIGIVEDLLAWRDDSEAPDEMHDFYFCGNTVGTSVTPRDAVFFVASLHAAGIPPVLTAHNNGNRKKKKLYLTFDWDHYFEYQDDYDGRSVLDVFCDFLRNNPPFCRLCIMGAFPKEPFRRIMEALHDNTYIKDLSFRLFGEVQGKEFYGECISNLLQHKDDFQILCFQECPFLASKSIIPGLRRPHKHLQSLDVFCALDDAALRVLLEAMKDGDFPALEELYLQENSITSVGLQSITELLPKAAPRLQKLHIKDYHFLRGEEITKDFADRILSSGDMECLKELTVECSLDANSVHIIKALEHDKAKLEVLNVDDYCMESGERAVCTQLLESIPKMKSLRRLVCDYGVFRRFSSSGGADPALFRNTSIVEFTTSIEPSLHRNASTIAAVIAEFQGRVAPIFHRNRDLARILSMSQPRPLLPCASSATAATTTSAAAADTSSSDDKNTTGTAVAAPRPVPRGQWSRILATVGREESRYGATPVFQFLQDHNRLASWLSSSAYDAQRRELSQEKDKRKRADMKDEKKNYQHHHPSSHPSKRRSLDKA